MTSRHQSFSADHLVFQAPSESLRSVQISTADQVTLLQARAVPDAFIACRGNFLAEAVDSRVSLTAYGC